MCWRKYDDNIYVKLFRYNIGAWQTDGQTDRLAIARQHIVVLTRDKNRCGIRVHQCHQMNYVLYDDVVLWLRRNCLYYSLKTDRLFFNFLVVKLSKFSRFCWWGTNDNSRHRIIVCGLVKKRKENAWRVSWIENMIFWCWTLLQPLMCTVRGGGLHVCAVDWMTSVGCKFVTLSMQYPHNLSNFVGGGNNNKRSK